jgi:hypothetical protein
MAYSSLGGRPGGIVAGASSARPSSRQQRAKAHWPAFRCAPAARALPGSSRLHQAPRGVAPAGPRWTTALRPSAGSSRSDPVEVTAQPARSRRAAGPSGGLATLALAARFAPLFAPRGRVFGRERKSQAAVAPRQARSRRPGPGPALRAAGPAFRCAASCFLRPSHASKAALSGIGGGGSGGLATGQGGIMRRGRFHARAPRRGFRRACGNFHTPLPPQLLSPSKCGPSTRTQTGAGRSARRR